MSAAIRAMKWSYLPNPFLCSEALLVAGSCFPPSWNKNKENFILNKRLFEQLHRLMAFIHSSRGYLFYG